MLAEKNLDSFCPDFFVQRHQHGFQLASEHQSGASSLQLPLASLIKAKMNVYFLNGNSEFHFLNNNQLETLNLGSMKEVFGKSVFDIFNTEDAIECTKNDKSVFTNQRIKIIQEEAILPDDATLRVISAKAPWYDADSKVIGIFGCSIILDSDCLIEPLMQLSQLGFLSSKEFQLVQQSATEILSPREKQCAHYLMRGKTAREIGMILHLSRRTIEHYIDTAKTKFNVKTKSELIDKLLAHNLSF